MSKTIKERPILFNGEMVRAILASKKTQTRRVMKSPPLCIPFAGPELYEPTVIVRGEEVPGEEIFGIHDMDGEWGVKCPYGTPGARLWVRETFHQHHEGEEIGGRPCYKADNNCPCHPTLVPWKPSIHMPRWASRIQLEITGIRAERVRDITSQDAFAEGVEDHVRGHVTSFAELWDSINLDRGYGWKGNPWVWVVEFKLVEANQ